MSHFCALLHKQEHSRLNDECSFVHVSYLSCFFLSVIFIQSSIFIRQEANWDCVVLTQLTWLFQKLQGDVMGFCHCHWWWGGLRPHYNASHRGTVELRKQPSWRSERNSLVCASENRGLVGGSFFLLRKWCSAPVVRGQKCAAFCTNALLPHLTCISCRGLWQI